MKVDADRRVRQSGLSVVRFEYLSHIEESMFSTLELDGLCPQAPNPDACSIAIGVF